MYVSEGNDLAFECVTIWETRIFYLRETFLGLRIAFTGRAGPVQLSNLGSTVKVPEPDIP
jgi:hypothetical protein